MKFSRQCMGHVVLFAVLYLLKNRWNNAGTLHLGQVSPFLSNHGLKGFSDMKAGNFAFHRSQQRETQIPAGDNERKPLKTESAPTNNTNPTQKGRRLSSVLLSGFYVSLPHRGEPWGAPITKREGTFLSHLRHRGNGSILCVYSTK